MSQRLLSNITQTLGILQNSCAFLWVAALDVICEDTAVMVWLHVVGPFTGNKVLNTDNLLLYYSGPFCFCGRHCCTFSVDVYRGGLNCSLSCLWTVFAFTCTKWFGICIFTYSQRSKLTFSKSRLLATFNGKMVAIKKNSVAKNKKTWRGGHFMTYYTWQKKRERGGHFMTYYTNA